jgi:hypothetical protein
VVGAVKEWVGSGQAQGESSQVDLVNSKVEGSGWAGGRVYRESTSHYVKSENIIRVIQLGIGNRSDSVLIS